MIDPAIASFFADRKEGWLKKKLTPDMDESEKQVVEQECEAVFSMENWLPAAAKRAGQMTISTHPCTFSHPSARKNKNALTSSVICSASYTPDGFIRTGNVRAESDALGNAAALDVYKFLTLTLADGKKLIEHIEDDTALAKDLLSVKSHSYEKLKNEFLAMSNASDSTSVTSSKIKQVYFPVDDSYHQLSILSNSGIIFELRKKIDELRFSERVKQGRECRKQQRHFPQGYSELFDITTIGYGGTKPQNISVLNNQNGGKAHLLKSVPPTLIHRKVTVPSENFFKQSIRYYNCREQLQRLDWVFKKGKYEDIPLEKLRTALKRCVADVIDVVVLRAEEIRSITLANEYSALDRISNTSQRIWLDGKREKERKDSLLWLDNITFEFTGWVQSAYKHVIKEPVLLGEAERQYLLETVQALQEAWL